MNEIQVFNNEVLGFHTRTVTGRDLNPSELNHRIVAAGAKRAEIISPSFRTVKYKELAIPSSQTIAFGGFEDG